MNMSYNIVKKIGEGSFSNVYLCKNVSSSLLMFSGIYNDDLSSENYFIVKEINLDTLVGKYVKKISFENFKAKKASEIASVSITPCVGSNNNQETYYYTRLQSLIESEIEVLKKISHENIVTYFSSDVEDSVYKIKMEYCVYGDLYGILKGNMNDFKLRNVYNGFDMRFVYKYLKDTISGLRYLHELNIIHRDIKLHNVLVKKIDNNFVFKLSDFGFACFDLNCETNECTSIFEYSSSALKKKYYKLCGTPYYMAPEIILHIEEFEDVTIEKQQVKFYGKKVDIWSYGICLYELICNILPFSNIFDIDGLTSFFKKSTTQNDIYDSIKTKNINSHIKEMLRNMLTIHPDFRMSSEYAYEIIHKTKQEVVIKNLNESIIDIVNCKENVYQKNEIMKENVIKVPIQINKDKDKEYNLTESWEVSDCVVDNLSSWDKINKSSSMIMKISVDDKFMKWLLNKK